MTKPHLARKSLPKRGDKHFARSRLTNGKDLLPGIDGRSTWARLMRDVNTNMMNHLGGEDYATEPQRLLVRRVAAFEAELIHLETAFSLARAAGRAPEASDLDLYSRGQRTTPPPRGDRLGSRAKGRHTELAAIHQCTGGRGMNDLRPWFAGASSKLELASHGEACHPRRYQPKTRIVVRPPRRGTRFLSGFGQR
jgi:hypothetical protein